MSRPPNPNSQQMPDWLRKKLQTATQANTIYMNWITNKDFQGIEHDLLVVKAFHAAEAFDAHLEKYLEEPKIMAPNGNGKGIHLT